MWNMYASDDATLKCRSLIQIKHRLAYWINESMQQQQQQLSNKCEALINLDDRVQFILNGPMPSTGSVRCAVCALSNDTLSTTTN